jgi:hypothetical protein
MRLQGEDGCHAMTVLSTIESAWSWKGVQLEKLLMQNAFGNVIVIDRQGVYWRFCPEELANRSRHIQ